MSKQDFLARLRQGLSGLPQDDIEERVTFYGEMIDDRMEDGLSEEEAVAVVGPLDEIVAQVVADMPFVKIARERIKPKRRMSAGEIVLLILGSPVWLSLIIAAVAVVFSLYVSLWAVIVSLWAVFASFAGCAVGGMLACVFFVVDGMGASGVAMLAAGLLCAGLSVFAFYGCKAATKGTVILTGKTVLWIKTRIIGKEGAR